MISTSFFPISRVICIVSLVVVRIIKMPSMISYVASLLTTPFSVVSERLEHLFFLITNTHYNFIPPCYVQFIT